MIELDNLRRLFGSHFFGGMVVRVHLLSLEGGGISM